MFAIAIVDCIHRRRKRGGGGGGPGGQAPSII